MLHLIFMTKIAKDIKGIMFDYLKFDLDELLTDYINNP